LSADELVGVVLGTGARGASAKQVAATLLATHGGLAGLRHVGLRALAATRGVGLGKAARLAAAIELGRRVLDVPLLRGRAIGSSHDVARAVRPRLTRLDHEEFLAIALDSKNRPIRELALGRGGLTGCPVRPADVFRALLREAASGVVFVHNHPSGEPTPSPEDIALTDRLVRAGELLGIRVVDHVIVGEPAHFSFLDAGLLPTRE
jgi:DNA repair protein RadC